MSLGDVKEQSPAERLPSELVSIIFEFYQSDLTRDTRQTNQISFNFSAVCASWRVASLNAQSFDVLGYDGLRALLGILKSRSSVKDRAITTLSYTGEPKDCRDDLPLLYELLEMSVPSLCSFSYDHSSLRSRDGEVLRKIVDVICLATRLKDLRWTSRLTIPVGAILR